MVILTTAESIKGTAEPNLSHRTPAANDPSIIDKLVNIVSSPMAEPHCSSGIKSDTQAFTTPSVEAA